MFDLSVYYLFLQYFDTVGWVFWPVKTLPYNLYCVGEDVKHCSIQSYTEPVVSDDEMKLRDWTDSSESVTYRLTVSSMTPTWLVIDLSMINNYCVSFHCVAPVWARKHCRISSSRFLAECCSFVLQYFVLFAFLTYIQFVYFPVLFCLPT